MNWSRQVFPRVTSTTDRHPTALRDGLEHYRLTVRRPRAFLLTREPPCLLSMNMIPMTNPELRTPLPGIPSPSSLEKGIHFSNITRKKRRNAFGTISPHVCWRPFPREGQVPAPCRVTSAPTSRTSWSPEGHRGGHLRPVDARVLAGAHWPDAADPLEPRWLSCERRGVPKGRPPHRRSTVIPFSSGW